MIFFPQSDASPLPPPDSPAQSLPTTVGPIYDGDGLAEPVEAWSADVEARCYPSQSDPYAPALIPEEPADPHSRYLRPHLARHERLRLSMVWYYAKELRNEPDLLRGLREKAHHARDSVGWEFAIVGILDVNVYIRLATAGLELSILPRGETLCGHAVTQPPGNVFQLPNMLEDWRFRNSPYVEQGGLIAYAGIPLRMQHVSGECIGLGSICVASSTPQPPLSKQQQQSLTRLADWIVADMVQSTRTRRQRERQRLSELLEKLGEDLDDPQESVIALLRVAYPKELISIQPCGPDESYINGDYTGLQSELQSGLWENTAYIDEFIANSNHLETPEDTVVRFISAPCESKLGHCILAVATKDFRRIFDDVDAWFVQACATVLTQSWQKRLLLEAIKVKETFIRGISHQLRTPIHGILGAAELLGDDLANASVEKASTYLHTISMAGRELMSTVNSMITLNRWTDVAVAKRHYKKYEISDLEKELVRGVSETNLGCATSKVPLFFHNHLPRDTCGLRTDINLFRNSILPLVINAIQNTTDGVVRITFSKQPDTTDLRVDVEDSGCGIQEDDQTRIFQLYEKVGEHSTRAGLGLTLATKYSTLLQGSVELVRSQINQGSHFRATFQDVAYATSVAPPTPVVSLLKNLPLKFLLPGNDTEVRSSFARFLTHHGLTPSEGSQDCFHVFEHSGDLKHTHKQLSSIRADQAAICLVSSSADTKLLRTLSNVTFVSAPFTTANLLDALHKADQSATNIDPTALENLAQSLHISSSCLPQAGHLVRSPSSTGSYTDEGEISTDGLHFTDRDQATSSSESSLEDPSPLDQAAQSGLAGRPLPRPRSAKPIVLAVDDNAVNLRILQMYCKSRGLDCLSATNGREAVEVFEKHQAGCVAFEAPIELVLMDLQMPVCDGLDATREIRTMEKLRGWPPSVLFMVTGQDSPDDREAADAAGADDYLVKPVGPKLLDIRLKESFPLFGR